jgi:4-hydroxy-tetrahydrodipicolinate reductase
MTILLNGALGRMGLAVTEAAAQAGHTVIPADARFRPGQGAVSVHDCQDPYDAVIDFSAPASLNDVLRLAVGKQKPAVLAVTGYSRQDERSIGKASESIALFKSANLSLGLNLMLRLAVLAAKILGEGYDPEIVETHHRYKADAPSGTARMLYEALSGAYGGSRVMQAGRRGAAVARKDNEIGVHSIRAGSAAGVHEVGFWGINETLTLTHHAHNRSLFAEGALKAAAFITAMHTAGKRGLYTMDDLLTDYTEGRG